MADSDFLALRREALRLRARGAAVVVEARKVAAVRKELNQTLSRLYQEARYVRHARRLGFGGEEF